MVEAGKAVAILLLWSSAAGVMFAGQLAGRTPPVLDSHENRSRALEMMRRDRAQPKREGRAAAKRHQQFTRQLADFAAAWNSLMQASSKGIWSAKRAQAVHKSFELLVHSEGWIELAGGDEPNRPDETAVR